MSEANPEAYKYDTTDTCTTSYSYRSSRRHPRTLRDPSLHSHWPEQMARRIIGKSDNIRNACFLRQPTSPLQSLDTPLRWVSVGWVS
ncbi:hypothetical protein E2C01_034530 [Portunus trituberculatus]|uniref:Uncharacterized protein n=1 Tax=Portunus trituberculatus TaxID=210409 RepID=A0A5B7F7A3_PORTR|nr:hypothetical protein [Portunus trituberculatus]